LKINNLRRFNCEFLIFNFLIRVCLKNVLQKIDNQTPTQYAVRKSQYGKYNIIQTMKKDCLLITFCVLSLCANTQTLTIQSGATVYTNSSSSSSTLSVVGAIQNSGTMTLGGGITGTTDMTFNGTLNVPLGGSTIGSGYDQILLTGTATLSSSILTVTLNAGYSPTAGTSFTILDAGTLSGTFSTVNLPTLSSGLTWSTSYNGAAGTVILSVSAVLPVELLNFRASTKEKTVLLDWETAVEQHTRDFTIERSRDGANFTPLSTMKAKGSNSMYDYLDTHPFVGVNYYRLRINDVDGKTSYSKITSAIIGDRTFKVKVFPSLVTDVVTITTDGGDISDFQVINIAGQIMLSKNSRLDSSSGVLSVNLSHLAQGIYLIKAKNTEGVATTAKIVKQ
jgi:Secretion system C-terminal sorting domain